jgi:hypothetical protein
VDGHLNGVEGAAGWWSGRSLNRRVDRESTVTGVEDSRGGSGSDDQRHRVALLSVVLCQPIDRGRAVNELAEEALRVFRTSWSRC